MIPLFQEQTSDLATKKCELITADAAKITDYKRCKIAECAGEENENHNSLGGRRAKQKIEMILNDCFS
jgi:hypothetical protein